MKHATLIIAMLVSIAANATPVAEQKKRNAIDDAAAKAGSDIKGLRQEVRCHVRLEGLRRSRLGGHEARQAAVLREPS